MKYLISILFFFHLWLLVVLNNFYVAGVPFRSLFILLIGGLVFLEGLSYYKNLFLLNVAYILLMLLGLLTSMVNGISASEILSNYLRIIQSYLIIVSGYYLLINFGYKHLSYIFIMIAIPSSVVGVLQFLDVDFAWAVREWLGGLQNKQGGLDIEKFFIENRLRPPGLSLFAIQQAYLLFSGLAFALFLFVRAYEKGEKVGFILLSIMILFLGCLASGTRSAIAACVVLIVITFLKVELRKTIAGGVFLIVLFGSYQLMNDNFQTNDARVLSLQDESAKGRSTLYKYGLELAFTNPLGFGYGFSTKEYAVEYFSNERNIFDYGATEKAQYLVEIHNSVLNIFHVYGLVGFAVFLVFLWNLVAVRWFFSAVIISYFMNAFFHNAGIMSGDLYFDIFISLILYYKYYIDGGLFENSSST